MAKKFKFLLLALICLGLLVGCGNDDTATTTSSTTTSYSYAGAVTPAQAPNIFGLTPKRKEGEFIYGWNITVTGTTSGTFSLDSGNEMEINGTFTTLDSGILKLKVTEATGTDAPEVGAEGYGLHIPGFVFLLSPVGGEGDLVPMVVAGTCPTEDFNINYILASRGVAGTMSDCAVSASDDSERDMAVTGVGSFDVSEGTFGSTARYDICNNNVMCNQFTTEVGCPGGCTWDGDSCEERPLTFTCSGGVADISNEAGDTILARLYLTANGGAIIGTNPAATDGTTLLGFPGDTISDASNLDGEYVGVTYLPGSTSQETTFAINVTIATESSTTTMTVIKVDPDTGADTGELENVVATIISEDSNTTGFFTASLALGNDTVSYLQCSVDLDVVSSGKNMINCILQKPCASAVTGPAGDACGTGETGENGNFVIVTK